MKSSVEGTHEDAVARPGGTPGEVFAAFLKLGLEQAIRLAVRVAPRTRRRKSARTVTGDL